MTTKADDAKRGWLNFITSQKPGGPLLQSLTYTFNKIGNLTARADGEFSANPLPQTTHNHVAYTPLTIYSYRLMFLFCSL